MQIDSDKLKETLSKIWQPALAGAVGGGALAGYMTSQDEDPEEDPKARRKRIMRNALAGTALGGAAGAAIPAGAKLLAKPFFGDTDTKPPLLERGLDSAITEGLTHAAPLGVGIAGTGVIIRQHNKNRMDALRQLLHHAGDKFKSGPSGIHATSAQQLDDLLKANPHLGGKLIDQATPGITSGELKHDPMSRFTLLDRLNEAGYNDRGLLQDQISNKMHNVGSPSSLDLLKRVLGIGGVEEFRGLSHGLTEAEKNEAVARGNYDAVHRVAVRPTQGDLNDRIARKAKAYEKFKAWLSEQGIISRQVAKLVGKGKVSPLSGIGINHQFDLNPLPELYRRAIRPSVSGRLPLPVKLGLLGAGVVGANAVQKRVMGE